MADELQGLLERINQEGIRKAEAERDRILAEARAEAARIEAAARASAEALVKIAGREAEALSAKGRDALRQAARDTLLSLRQELQNRLEAVVRAGVGAALPPQTLAGILQGLIEKYLAASLQGGKLDIQLPAGVAAQVEREFFGRLREDLRANVRLEAVPGLGGGFKLVFKGDDVVYDFSDAALADALGVFLSPKLAELVRTPQESGK